MTSNTQAAPGDVLFRDNLNGNLRKWTVVASGGNASIGNETSNSGRSLRTRWGPVSVTSEVIDTAVPAASLTAWIRRGSDAFSEDTDAGEDLVLEYRDAGGNWQTIAVYLGEGIKGEILDVAYVLPAAALHSNFAIRFRQTDGDGTDYDYWHIDDVEVSEIVASVSTFAPGSCATFTTGLEGWTITSNGGDAGVSGVAFGAAPHALFTRWQQVTVTSPTADMDSALLANLSIWIRRGSDAFSEYPDTNEDLVIEYLDTSGTWQLLELFAGGGTEGEVFVRTYPLPDVALHNAFQVRVRQTGGSGTDSDYWHIDDVCLNAVQQIRYSFEESSWTGAAGEVLEENGSGLNGTVIGGATNSQTNPALPTNPGTCLYGIFDGVDDYIEIADDRRLDFSDSLTAAAWINVRSRPADLYTIISKDWNYEFHVNSSGQIYWWWNDSGGNTRTLTTATSITANRWFHIAITYASGLQTIYIDGSPAAQSTYTGTLRVNDIPLHIGTDWNLIDRAFDGLIDEVTLLPQALSQADIQALQNSTHPCASAGAQFTINHDTFGIHCVPEVIAVNVIDSGAGTPLLNYNAQVGLDTQTGNGTWRLVRGSGGFRDAVADDGIALYNWPIGESQALFALTYSAGTSSMDIDVEQVTNTGIRDNDAEGVLVFSASGFSVTSVALANPPPTVVAPFAAAQIAAVPFDVHIAAFGQTPNDPACGIIESYTGNKNLEFWSTYIDPGSGSRNVEVDGAAIATAEGGAATQVVTFANGQAVVSAKYKDVGLIQLAMKDTTTVNAELPNGIRGATAGFVVKPAGFTLTDIRDGAGTVINPQALDADGDVFIAAGDNFRTTVTARDAEGDPTPNYGQENIAENVRLDATTIAPVTGLSPAVTATTGFFAFNNGTSTGTDFQWHEVGIMQLRAGVGDGDYLGSGDAIGGYSENVGRFIPSYFSTSSNVPIFETQCTAGTFSYIGEPFGYVIAPEIMTTARSANGTAVQNYTGAFFKLSTSTLRNRDYSSAVGSLDTSGLPLAGNDPSVIESAPSVGLLSFGSGTGLRYTRTIPVAPFDAEIAVSIDVIDDDGVRALANPVVIGAIGGIGFDAGEEMRYGRLRFGTAIGSELVDLPLPLVAEYFAGTTTGFVGNINDTCTTNVELSFITFTEQLSSGDTCVRDSGSPGESNVGCVAAAPIAQRFSEPPIGGDFNLILAAPGADNTGSITIRSAAPAWLQFDWDQAAPGLEDPTGTAAFGLFSGEETHIYMREIYN